MLNVSIDKFTGFTRVCSDRTRGNGFTEREYISTAEK